MKPAECKLHKNLSTVWDNGVAAFQKLFRELKYLLCTVTCSLLWTIFCEFYYNCRLWMSLLWSLPSSLVNQVNIFYLSPSIHPPPWNCSDSSQRLSAVNNYCDCNLANTVDLVEFAVEFADAEIGGEQAWQCWKTWHWELLQWRDRQCWSGRLTMDVCTHTAYFLRTPDTMVKLQLSLQQ